MGGKAGSGGGEKIREILLNVDTLIIKKHLWLPLALTEQRIKAILWNNNSEMKRVNWDKTAKKGDSKLLFVLAITFSIGKTFPLYEV